MSGPLEIVAISGPIAPAGATSPDEPATRRSQAALSGVAFTLGTYTLTRVVNLAVTIVLARSIAVEGMGVVAAALLAVEIIDMIRDFGLRDALIYEPRQTKAMQVTAFTVMGLVALLQSLALVLFAPVARAVVEDPIITPVLIWLALLFPLNSLTSVHEAMLQRSFRFGRVSLAEMVGIAVKAAVAFYLLLHGAGIWSIVAGILCGAACRSAALWVLSDWRPTGAWPSLELARHLMVYGRHVIMNKLLGVWRYRADQLAIVALLGDTALGLYFVAARIPEIAIFGINVAITKVIFPLFSSLSESPRDLERAYLTTVNACMSLLAPASIGLAVVAPLLVPVLFGPEWEAAVPVLALLALSGLPMTIGWSAGDFFKATGRPQLLSVLMLIDAAVTGPLIWVVALATRDMVAVAGAIVAGECIAASFRLWYMRRRGGVSIQSTLAAALRPIMAANAMGAGVLLLGRHLQGFGAPAALVISIGFGVLVYAAVLIAIDRPNLQEKLRVIMRRSA